MKKFICLSICLILAIGALSGCSLVDRNYERDYSQIIATIQPITKEVVGKKTVLDQNGLPAVDEYGKVIKEDVTHTYTSQKTYIYKSQLVNYVNYYLSDDLQNYGQNSAAQSVNRYTTQLLQNELLLIEADSLFDAGILYWTKADVDQIQRSVYKSISDELFTIKNQLLALNNLPERLAKGGDPSIDEPKYPSNPAFTNTTETDAVSPAYPVSDDDSYQWFDAWYLDQAAWYINTDGYKNTFPGLVGGSLKEKSLNMQAFSVYLDSMIQNAENLIGATDEQKAQIKIDIQEINKIRANQGVSYVYPFIGSTLMFKLLVGNSYVKNQKLAKLENYINYELTDASEGDITEFYNNTLKQQKTKFATQATYDQAVKDGETILYTPSNRYVFVKHILLPFSEAQTTQLAEIKKQQGTNEDNITNMRAAMARNITVYPHKNGDDDLSRPMTVAQVTATITAKMNELKNSPKLAEQAFTNFIYEYNTDPGIFGNEMGYGVVYELGEGESETYMTEFAMAARAFRDGDYQIGDIYYDEDIKDEKGKPVPYIITDYGIHIMYYNADPVAGEEKPLDGYVTAGEYSKIYDLMKEKALEKLRTDAFTDWKSRNLRKAQTDYTSIVTKIVDSYIKEIEDMIG